MYLLLRLVFNALAIWIASLWVDGIEITQAGSTGGQIIVVLVIALIFGLVNALVKPIVKFFALPFYVLTLGLFTFVVNALMLMLTSWLTEFTRWGLFVDGFWPALLGSLVISILTWVLSPLARRPRRRR